MLTKYNSWSEADLEKELEHLSYICKYGTTTADDWINFWQLIEEIINRGLEKDEN